MKKSLERAEVSEPYKRGTVSQGKGGCWIKIQANTTRND